MTFINLLSYSFSQNFNFNQNGDDGEMGREKGKSRTYAIFSINYATLMFSHPDESVQTDMDEFWSANSFQRLSFPKNQSKTFIKIANSVQNVKFFLKKKTSLSVSN